MNTGSIFKNNHFHLYKLNLYEKRKTENMPVVSGRLPQIQSKMFPDKRPALTVAAASLMLLASIYFSKYVVDPVLPVRKNFSRKTQVRNSFMFQILLEISFQKNRNRQSELLCRCMQLEIKIWVTIGMTKMDHSIYWIHFQLTTPVKQVWFSKYSAEYLSMKI